MQLYDLYEIKNYPLFFNGLTYIVFYKMCGYLGLLGKLSAQAAAELQAHWKL